MATAQRAREAQARSGVVVEELIITAKEAIDNLEDAPVAVTTFTAEQRNLVAINTIDDLVNLTPGTTISGNGINMRGVGRQSSETADLGTDPGVAYYVNGFYSVVAGVIGESTLYSETVQFQRGPQGTRFGRNAIAGTASLWARRPTKTIQGQAVAQYGRRNFWGLGFNVAGPLTDDYGIRLGWQHFATDKSYQKNIFPTKAGIAVENNYFEFQIEGNPTDQFHFWLRSTAFQYMSDPFYTVPPVYNTTAPMGALVPNATFRYATPAPTEPRQINVDTKGADRLTGNQVHILNMDYDFGPVTAYYVGGYATFKAKGYSDLDRAGRISYVACTPSATVVCAPGTVPGSGFPNNRVIPTRQVQDYLNRNHYFTHEVRLQNNDTSKVDWVIGAFYLNSDYNERYQQSLPEEVELERPIVSFTGPMAFAPAAPNPERIFYSQHNIRRTRSVAGFADVIYHLNDQIDLLAGVRHSIESARATTKIRYIFFNPAFGRALDVTPGTPGGAAGASGFLFKLRNEETTGRIGVDWHPTDDTLLYVKYSRGFKAGGFNLGNITALTGNVYGPETLDAYEAGVRHQFAGRSLRVGATVFWYDYQNLQIRLPALNATTGTIVTQNINVDEARIRGLEAEATWQPVPELYLHLNYTFLDAETVSYCCVQDITLPAAIQPRGLPLDGKRLPRTPENKVGAIAAYTFNFDPGSLILGTSASYTDVQFQNALENPFQKIPDFTQVNASITWRSADNRYDLVAQVTNLFDVNRVASIEITGNNLTAVGANNILSAPVYTAPRFWQVQLRYRW